MIYLQGEKLQILQWVGRQVNDGGCSDTECTFHF